MFPCTYPILDTKNLSKHERWEEEELEFALIFKIGSNIQQAKELLIQSFLKEGLNPRFDLSLRDFIDNSNAIGPSHTLLEQLWWSGNPC